MATTVADIVMRADGASGATGDLFQARVNGSIIAAAGDIEATVNSKATLPARDGVGGAGAATWVAV